VNPIKIEILKPNPSGSCSTSCPLFLRRRKIGCCQEINCAGITGFIPGPSCPGPGVYELVPEGTMEKIKRKAALWDLCVKALAIGEEIPQCVFSIDTDSTDPLILDLREVKELEKAARKMMEG